MINSRNLASKISLRPDEEYFAGCLGFAILISAIGGWIHSGCPLSWVPPRLALAIAWMCLGAFQFLTMLGLRRHLASLGRGLWWTWPLLMLWIAFDAPLAALERAYVILPLGYGITQAIFLFDLRKPRRGGSDLDDLSKPL